MPGKVQPHTAIFLVSPVLILSLVKATLLHGQIVPLDPQRPALNTTRLAQEHPYAVAFSPDGKWLATGDHQGIIRLWEVANGKEIRRMSASQGPVLRLAFSPDGKELVSENRGGSTALLFWNPAKGLLLRRVGEPLRGVGISCLAYSPDGRLLAYGLGEVVLQDVHKGKKLYRLPTRSSVDSVAFSPDGRTLATANGNNTVELWEIASGQRRRLIQAKQCNVTMSQAVAFSRNGRRLYTAGMDGSIGVWDLPGGKQEPSLPGGQFAMWLSTSPDGRALLSGHADGPRL